MIKEGSPDEALIADWMEDNMWFRQTTIFLNQHRVEEGRVPVGQSVVISAFDWMMPKVDRVQKVVQGGRSKAWVLARKRQTKQLLVMQGQITKKTHTRVSEWDTKRDSP